jgi:hypothetical protein
MAPVGDVEIGAGEPVEVQQHVAVEGGGDAQRVVVGGLEYRLPA